MIAIAKQAAVILNPRSGTHAAGSDAIASALTSAGLSPSFKIIDRNAGPADLARDAVKQGFKTVVACGGDGTVGAVASALVGTDTALGVIPAGTLNHFAKDLGIPLDFLSAAQVISSGKTTQVDVGQVNGRTFVNNSSLGIYPEIVIQREDRHRKGLNKWIALAMSTAAVLKRYPFISVRVEIEGKHVSQRTPFVFIGNNVYEIQGLNIGRRRDLTSGQLCVYMAAPVSRAGLVGMAAMALVGGLDKAKTLRTFSARECVIEGRRRRVRVSLDGEVAQMETPLYYTSVPAALKVLVP